MICSALGDLVSCSSQLASMTQILPISRAIRALCLNLVTSLHSVLLSPWTGCSGIIAFAISIMQVSSSLSATVLFQALSWTQVLSPTPSVSPASLARCTPIPSLLPRPKHLPHWISFTPTSMALSLSALRLDSGIGSSLLTPACVSGASTRS